MINKLEVGKYYKIDVAKLKIEVPELWGISYDYIDCFRTGEYFMLSYFEQTLNKYYMQFVPIKKITLRGIDFKEYQFYWKEEVLKYISLRNSDRFIQGEMEL